MKIVGIFVGILLTCFVLALGIHSFVNHYLDKSPTNQTVNCTKKGQNHLVIMLGNSATPNHINAKLCDTLTIKNADDQIRLVAFGEHEHHQAYDGVLERTLQQNQSLTVALNKTGTYHFHDHLDDLAQGNFTVR